jgi:hypothetical protein
MAKKSYFVIIGLVTILFIPTTSALPLLIETSDADIEVINRTIIRGLILFPRETNSGKTMTFFAIRLHYTTITLDGVDTGVVRLKSVTIPNKLTGYSNRFYIIGTFRGNLNF